VNPRYPAVAERAGYRCEYCRAPEVVFNFPLEVEHIVPRARGGDDSLENLALACRACNLFKSDSETGVDDASQSEMALFNPRRDIWHGHFEVDVGTGEIFGLTPVGRATAARLQLNRPRHINARKRWMRLELFP
jgi:hypothetical protein